MKDLTPQSCHEIPAAFLLFTLATISVDSCAYSDDELYCYQKFSNAEYAGAAKHCRVAAMNGDAEAQFKLASLYAQGNGLEQDLASSATWLERASLQGHQEATYNLAFACENGNGIAPDLTRAAQLYRVLAEQGHTKSQRNLALLYETGRGVTKDWRQAFNWHLKTAEDGFARGQLRVGLMLLEGRGTVKNESQGIAYLQKAAAAGEADAQFFLARVLIDEQPDTAVLWFQRAIDQDHTMAMYQYAKHLALESDVAADHDLAADLADRAVKAGSAESVRLAAAINEKIAKADAQPSTRELPVTQPQQFTLQIISLSSMPRVEAFIEKYGLDDARIHPIQRNGRTIYIVTLGEFESHSAANTAKQRLPADLRKLNPMIRQFEQFQLSQR